MIKLDKHGHLNEFMMLLKLLQSGEFPMDNIVFLLLLEWICFQKCPNTVGMRYSERIVLKEIVLDCCLLIVQRIWIEIFFRPQKLGSGGQ